MSPIKYLRAFDRVRLICDKVNAKLAITLQKRMQV
jgi:hypothetical protein